MLTLTIARAGRRFLAVKVPGMACIVGAIGLSQEPATKEVVPVPKLHSVDMVKPIDDLETTKVIVHFRFSKEPLKERSVTVLPLVVVPPEFAPTDQEVKLAQFQIQETTKHRGDCESADALWWSGTAQSPSIRRYYNYLNPPPVVLIYPAVTFARLLSPEPLKNESLPKDVSVPQIKAAIDLDRDGQPDLLVVEHYCVASANGQGALPCYDYYQKVDGAWVLLRRTTC
jgi:hypothetical protein